MKPLCAGLLMALVFLEGAATAVDSKGTLIAVRTRAYDANFHNDQAGLKAALAELKPLQAGAQVGALARYYSAWTNWALSASQVQAGETAGAIASAEAAETDIRAALKEKDDVEFHTMLVNALVVQAVLDNRRFATLLPEMGAERKRALELGPANPRAVLMDAGILFNTPAERGGGQDKGIARWQEALRLLEEESRRPPADPLQPDWGLALAHGWVSNVYLTMTPPRVEDAKRSAARALELRPDFWYVTNVIVPRLAGKSAP
jgi:hypothetical protein